MQVAPYDQRLSHWTAQVPKDTARLSKRTQRIQVVHVGNWTGVLFGREKSKSDRIQDGSEIKWGNEKYRKHAGKNRLLE